MSPSRAGETRPSRRQIKKPWITGSVALGVIAASSGAAMATMRTSDDPAMPSPTATTPAADLCLHLDRKALTKIHIAEHRAKAKDGTVDVRLPADVVYTCPGPTTPPTGGPTEEPTAPPTEEPTTPPTEEPTTPPTGEPTASPEPTQTQTPPETTPPETTPPVPSVTSTAS